MDPTKMELSKKYYFPSLTAYCFHQNLTRYISFKLERQDSLSELHPVFNPGHPSVDIFSIFGYQRKLIALFSNEAGS